MISMHHQLKLIFFGLIFLQSFVTIDSLMCFQCMDCPEPFNQDYPFVSIVNNTNFRSQCLKKIVHLGNGYRLVSKGTVFSCPIITNVNDVQIHCCDHDYCNAGFKLGPSILSILSIFYISS